MWAILRNKKKELEMWAIHKPKPQLSLTVNQNLKSKKKKNQLLKEHFGSLNLRWKDNTSSNLKKQKNSSSLTSLKEALGIRTSRQNVAWFKIGEVREQGSFVAVDDDNAGFGIRWSWSTACDALVAPTLCSYVSIAR